MKKEILAGCIFSFMTVNAFAASDNTITFQGEVATETCSVTVNGNTASPIVLLPTVSTTQLSASGNVAGATEFEIGVTGCTGALTSTPISTVFAGNLVTTNGNLGSTGAATNVEIQILDTTNAVIDFQSGFTGSSDLTLAPSETEASATYTAQYYATGVSTAGSVESSLQYAIAYQ